MLNMYNIKYYAMTDIQVGIPLEHSSQNLNNVMVQKIGFNFLCYLFKKLSMAFKWIQLRTSLQNKLKSYH